MYNMDMHKAALLKLFVFIFAASLAMSPVAADYPCSVDTASAQCVELVRLKAEQGNADAQSHLGALYYKGRGVKQDYHWAAHWLYKAAVQGDVQAQFYLGVIYYHGRGVELNHKEAKRWFRKAAAQGDKEAQNNLDAMNDTGRKGSSKLRPQSVGKFLLWLIIAVALPALFFIMKKLDSSNSSNTISIVGIKNIREAAEQGHSESQFNLGLAYDKGMEDIEKDVQEALRWYHKAAEQGHANAQCLLGWMYQKGENMEQDEQGAARWYRLAAEQGHAQAQNNLGMMYYQGEGVDEDRLEACIWLIIAEVGGEETAGKALRELPWQLTPEETQSAKTESARRMVAIKLQEDD